MILIMRKSKMMQEERSRYEDLSNATAVNPNGSRRKDCIFDAQGMIMRAQSLNRKEVEPQKVKRNLTRTSSRTEDKFPTSHYNMGHGHPSSKSCNGHRQE